MIEHMIYLIEGPDGSGKSTLVRDVVRSRHAIPLPRNCTPLGGPRDDNLKKYLQWTIDNFPRLSQDSQLYVLDRHPCISELIYGPQLRGKAKIGDSAFLFWSAFATLKNYVDVIYCMPPMEVVLKNLTNSLDEQHQGVVDQGQQLYMAYQAFIDAGPFPDALIYDYTRDGEWV